jgi:hypothetical protein
MKIRCKGCNGFNEHTNACMELMLVEKDGQECPCIKCLIKGICGVSCEDFVKFYKLVYNINDLRP